MTHSNLLARFDMVAPNSDEGTGLQPSKALGETLPPDDSFPISAIRFAEEYRKDRAAWTTATKADTIMADPFEVRMRFSNQLGQLNASVVSLQKAATYALKYKDMDEDLHSCILEQVERVRFRFPWFSNRH